MNLEIAFIGAGNMASAMIKGILKNDVYTPENVGCTSANDGTGEKLSKLTGITFNGELTSLLQQLKDSSHEDPAIIVLAIKPQQLKELPPEVEEITSGKIILSILAGIPLKRLAVAFPNAKNIVRAMPNTPGQIGAGITCYASRKPLSSIHRQRIEQILGALGEVIPTVEKNLDAVTAVSGSGPAYLFEFAAAMRNAGIRVGLDEDIAYKLTLQTLLGAAQLLKETGESPDTLRDMVTSPNGTTQAALEILEKSDFREMVKEAIIAAKNRSIELSRNE